jgi:hypothetical protein
MGKKLVVTRKAASGPEREIFNMGENAVGGPRAVVGSDNGKFVG